MVQVNRQSVSFCKYTIAALILLALITGSLIPVYIVFALMLFSAATGIERAPLVLLFDRLACPRIRAERVYINYFSMRFAHTFGCIFCVLIILAYYFAPYVIFFILLLIFALLQSIAAFGYCSAAKLYECLICNSNCCRFGKKIRGNR
jgi:hypothetical protein